MARAARKLGQRRCSRALEVHPTSYDYQSIISPGHCCADGWVK